MDEVEIDLMQYIRILKKRIWLLVLLPLLFGLISYVVSAYFITEIYEADSTIYVVTNRSVAENNASMGITNADVMNDLRLGDLLVDDVRVLMKQRTLLTEVINSLGYQEQLTPQALAKMIDVNIEQNSRVLRVKLKNSDPKLAVILVDRVTSVLQKEVGELIPLRNIHILDKGQLPTSPISPRVPMNVAIALILGLLVAVGISLLLEYLDNTLKTVEDVEKYLNLPVLAVVPLIEEQKTQAVRSVKK